MSETCTIILTDQPPVRIRESEWPVIAHAHSPMAIRHWRADLRVRQHADGRAIVYGVYRHITVFPGEHNFTAHAGVLVPKDADLVAAIRTVGLELARATREAGHDYSAHIQAAVRDCIEGLPARELE